MKTRFLTVAGLIAFGIIASASVNDAFARPAGTLGSLKNDNWKNAPLDKVDLRRAKLRTARIIKS